MSESNGFVNRRSPVQSGSPAPSGSSGYNPTPAERAVPIRVVEGAVPERLLASCDRSGGESACWPWLKARGFSGYGQIKVNGKSRWAHRVSYAAFNGPIPKHRFVLHRCGNSACINPRHLYLGDAKQNALDALAMGRTVRGSRVNTAKLSEGEVAAIRILNDEGWGGGRIAAAFNVSRSMVFNVVTRRNWTHVRALPSPRPDTAERSAL